MLNRQTILKYRIILAQFNMQYVLSLSRHHIKANKQVCWNWVARSNVHYWSNVFLFAMWRCSLSMGIFFWMQLQSKHWWDVLARAVRIPQSKYYIDLPSKYSHEMWNVNGCMKRRLLSSFCSFNGYFTSVRKVHTEQHYSRQVKFYGYQPQ